jgi:protoporphyrinogen oxidase
MNKIAVIGGGPMGLATAYRLLKSGQKVDIFEADDRLGGMSAPFNFNGLDIERYYHFICKTDYPLFNYLDELNLASSLIWQDTKMGFYFKDGIYPWGNPLALLTFPHASLIAKFRYALHVFITSKRKSWESLDKRLATEWLKKGLGREAYDTFWRSLIELKFFEHSDKISAAWIGTRIARVAKSRKSIFTESLGYLEGGSKVLIDALENEIKRLGGNVYLKSPVQSINSEKDSYNNSEYIDSLTVGGETVKYNSVVSTVPLPYLSRLATTLPNDELEKLKSVINIGVVCTLIKMKRAFSPYFWVNINDKNISIPGVIEYTNLNPLNKREHLLYIPYYMPQSHPKYADPSKWFADEAIAYLKHLKKDFSESDILDITYHRYEFAQAVCTPKFKEKLPPMQSKLKGLFLADTSYYYPEDRSISESFKVGDELADLCLNYLSGVKDSDREHLEAANL